MVGGLFTVTGSAAWGWSGEAPQVDRLSTTRLREVEGQRWPPARVGGVAHQCAFCL